RRTATRRRLATLHQYPALQKVERAEARDELLVGHREREQESVEKKIRRVLSEIAEILDREAALRSPPLHGSGRVRAVGGRKHVLLAPSLRTCDDPRMKSVGNGSLDERRVIPQIRSEENEATARSQHAVNLGIDLTRLRHVLHDA